MDQRKAKQIFIIVSVSFFAFGLLNASIGPLLEEFAGNNAVSLASIGGIFSALFLGAFLAQVVIGSFTDRWGHHRTLAIAFLDLALMMIAMTFSRWFPLTLALVFLAGLGYGTAVLSGNVLIGQLFHEKSVSALNWVNVFFGVGDVIGPMVVSLSLFLWKSGLTAILLGSFILLVSALALIASSFKLEMNVSAATEKSADQFKVTPFLLSLALIILIYLGSEATMGGWTTTYIHGTTLLGIEQAALVTSGFWLALTLGRLMGALIGSRISAYTMLKICFSIALLGVILFVVSYGHVVWSIVAIVVIGVGFGSVFPTIFSVVTTTFKGASGKAGGILTATGSLSASLIPWLQGLILVQYGARTVTYMMAILITLLWAGLLINLRLNKKLASTTL